MTEIKDKRSAGKGVEDTRRFLFQPFPAGEKGLIVEVALDGAFRLQGLGDPGQGDVLVKAYALDTGFDDVILDQLAAIPGESNNWDMGEGFMQPFHDLPGRLGDPALKLSVVAA